MSADRNSPDEERRRYPRAKIHVSVEIHVGDETPPLRLSTEDLSMCGCYVETMFTLEIGTQVNMTLWLNEEPIVSKAVVATKYPQLGNGFDFVEMSHDDLLKLAAFIQTISSEAQKL